MRRKQFNNVFRTPDLPQKGRQKSTINVAKMNSCWARGPDPPPQFLDSQESFISPRSLTHFEEHRAQIAGLVPSLHLPNPPKQRVLRALFGEADMRGTPRVYCFIGADGQSILRLTQWQCVDLHSRALAYATTYISGKTETD
jgi:hypothetical protein